MVQNNLSEPNSYCQSCAWAITLVSCLLIDGLIDDFVTAFDTVTVLLAFDILLAIPNESTLEQLIPVAVETFEKTYIGAAI